MIPPLKIAAAAAVAVSAIAAAGLVPGPRDATEVVILAPGSFGYYQLGEYLRDGVPQNPPLATVTFDRPLAVMKQQVSVAAYARCVAGAVCAEVNRQPVTGDDDATPIVGVSWRDATAYAAWLSRETGFHYRLPTDAEWAYAAGHLFHDNLIVASNGDRGNPAARWLATYESEAKGDPGFANAPQPFGTFGINERGLSDVGGNVWEWTDTCYARHAVTAGRGDTTIESCGVRVVEGAHRTYFSDFVRNPKGGGCSVGTPPSNFGIRLVREDGGFLDGFTASLRRFLPHPG